MPSSTVENYLKAIWSLQGALDGGGLVLIGHVAAKVAQKTEQNIWAGADGNEGEFDGFTALATADGIILINRGSKVEGII